VYISIQGNRGVAASTQRAQLATSDTAFGGRRPKFLAHIGKKTLFDFFPSDFFINFAVVF
jgi:hypothetical protein